MRIRLYLFPGFIIGPIVGSLLVNLANGVGLMHTNEIGLTGLVVAGLATTAAFYLTDEIISG